MPENYILPFDTTAHWLSNNFLKNYSKQKRDIFISSLKESLRAYYDTPEFNSNPEDIGLYSNRLKPSPPLINALYLSGVPLYDFPSHMQVVIKSDGTVIAYNPESNANCPARSIIFKPKS